MATAADYYTANWRQDVLEMIEDDRIDAAKSLLEEAVERRKFISNPIERINQGRFLGDAFSKLNNAKRARVEFEKAMKASLQLKPVWRSLSAVISVLELQAETDDTAVSRTLLQQSLDARLLPNMAKNSYASEIGRYVKRFEPATRAQIFELLDQLRGIKNSGVRKKSFYALTELPFAPFTGEGRYTTLSLPLGMDDFERFLWFTVMSKYFAESDQRFKFEQQVEGMQKAYDRLGEERKTKYRKIYRMVKKLNYQKKSAPVKQKDESKAPAKSININNSIKLSKPSKVKAIEPYVSEGNTELRDLYYGGAPAHD